MRFDSRDPRVHVRAENLSRNRHETYFRQYLQWIDDTRPAEPSARQVTILARSPLSPVIEAMMALADDLLARGVSVRVVYSDVDPERALQDSWGAIGALSQGREHGDLIRWASPQGILEAHEQTMMGGRMCWLGDAMRREPGRRDGFDIFETDSPQSCLLAAKSFAAMWKFATPVPSWMLRDAGERKPNATFAGPDPRALATLSFFRQLQKSDTLCH